MVYGIVIPTLLNQPVASGTPPVVLRGRTVQRASQDVNSDDPDVAAEAQGGCWDESLGVRRLDPIWFIYGLYMENLWILYGNG